MLLTAAGVVAAVAAVAVGVEVPAVGREEQELQQGKRFLLGDENGSRRKEMQAMFGVVPRQPREEPTLLALFKMNFSHCFAEFMETK